MTVWALADLHLSISVPSKSMEVFGPRWEQYQERIQENWQACVGPDDLVLLPGDISWAKYLDEAVVDLEWIDALPGSKVMIRGNHDYWWGSLNKMQKVLPPSIHAIHKTAFLWNDIAIAGARLWDTEEYSFNDYIEFNQAGSKLVKPHPNLEEKLRQDAKIFDRDLQGLELSLKQLAPDPRLRIVMTHYPPISATLAPSRASTLLEQYGIDICVFGHLHNTHLDKPMFGTHKGVQYILAAADAIDMRPIKICD